MKHKILKRLLALMACVIVLASVLLVPLSVSADDVEIPENLFNMGVFLASPRAVDSDGNEVLYTFDMESDTLTFPDCYVTPDRSEKDENDNVTIVTGEYILFPDVKLKDLCPDLVVGERYYFIFTSSSMRFGFAFSDIKFAQVNYDNSIVVTQELLNAPLKIVSYEEDILTSGYLAKVMVTTYQVDSEIYKEYYTRSAQYEVLRKIYAAGYNSGSSGPSYQDGYNEGFNVGYDLGRTGGYSEGIEDGYDIGLEKGYEWGFPEGETQGYQNGYADGKANGITEGETSGYQKGYTEGKADGITEGEQTIIEKYKTHIFAEASYKANLYCDFGSGQQKYHTFSFEPIRAQNCISFENVLDIIHEWSSTKFNDPVYIMDYLDYVEIEINWNQENAFDLKKFPIYIYGTSDVSSGTITNTNNKTYKINTNNNSADMRMFEVEAAGAELKHMVKTFKLKVGRPEDLLCEFTLYSESEAYNVGYEEGYKYGEENGEATGYSTGYSNGFISGKAEGLSLKENSNWRELMNAIVEAPVNTFRSLFNFEILGLDMRAAFGSVLALCMVLIIVKKVIL